MPGYSGKADPRHAQAIRQAITSAKECGDGAASIANSTDSFGLRRLEGKARIASHWKVGTCVYLAGFKGRENAKLLIHFLRCETGDDGHSADVQITGIRHKRLDSDYGFVTVGWKATIRNRAAMRANYTVEAIFIDMERFELARDFEYGVILSPGQSQTVSGTVMMKSPVYRSVADLLIKVTGYPISPM